MYVQLTQEQLATMAGHDVWKGGVVSEPNPHEWNIYNRCKVYSQDDQPSFIPRFLPNFLVTYCTTKYGGVT